MSVGRRTLKFFETTMHCNARRAGDRFSIRTDQGEHEALARLCASGSSPRQTRRLCMETNIEGIFAALAAEQYISRKKSGTVEIRDWWYAAEKEEARPRA